MGAAQKIDSTVKAAEHAQEREISSKFSARIRAAIQDVGQADTMRHSILTYVAAENYQRAIDELQLYVKTKDSYPQFKERTERYMMYAVDLINAVRAKRSFPGLQHLSMSKQQDLCDRALEHFEDLKVTLRKIEQIDREIRLDDVRSTVWVVKACVYCLMAILILAFVRELTRGVLPAFYFVLDQISGDFVNRIFDMLGL